MLITNLDTGIYPGHPLGSHWVNHKRRQAYLNIPKCATLSVKDAVTRLGFRPVSRPEAYPGYEWFIVLRRGIIDRWVSGTLEWWYRTDNPWTLSEYVTEELEILTSKGRPSVRDAHTLPQAMFIPPYLEFSEVFFVEDGLGDLATYLGTPIDRLNTKLVQDKDVIYQRLDEDHENFLNDFYRIDHLLIESLDQ
jgi:hypothetical protein